MIVELVIFLITTAVVYFVYSHWRNEESFKRKGLKLVPGWPIFGNTLPSTFGKRHFVEDINYVYSAFPNERYVGYMEGTQPIVLVRDPALIKMITVKDFDHFVDHRQFFSDPLFTQSLFLMKGDRWRQMRTTLSPAFTGSKMRNMIPFMIEIGQNIIEYLTETEGQVINIGDLVRKYTNDVIASTAFGLQVNSLKDPNNDFYKHGQTLLNFSRVQLIKMILIDLFPSLSKHLPIFLKETTDFFVEIITKTMKHREKNNIERPDMIQLLMEASKGTLKANEQDTQDNIGFSTTEEANINVNGESRRWSENELVAQAFIFFTAAFESSATVLVMAIHELAVNKEVQEKLYEEVKSYHDKHGKISYEGLQELKYLDCVLNETFRKWSPAMIMDRVCQKSYTLPPPREGGVPYTIEAGDVVYNMVNSLHMDDQYYPEPTKFDPERFSDENKRNIKPFTFMPFGIGPRNCIGSRFALLELKILLYLVIVQFEVQKCEKTSDPIKLQRQAGEFGMKAEGGTWLKFRSRN